MGFANLAAGDLLARELGSTPQVPLALARAKKVIWVFLSGGVSQLESFDPKPALNTHAGKTFNETPFPDPHKSPVFLERSRSVLDHDRIFFPKIFPLQVGFKKRGQSGIEVSDWFPELGSCVDDMAVVRSMYTTDNDHAAEFQMHTGRHALDEKQPCLGSWIHYGLGSLNANLPAFIFLGQFKDPRVRRNIFPDYLGAEHSAVELEPGLPLAFGVAPKDLTPQRQAKQFDLIKEFHQAAQKENPLDPRIEARLKSYELAFRMQTAVPGALDLSKETEETQRLYGIDNPTTAVYGRRLLAARRLAEQGVRYNLVYLSDYGEWDSHNNLKENHGRSCARVDKPLAGLLRDLKRRGMFDDTLVVWCTEFGRTPGLEAREKNANPTGRDHHPHGFTVWLAGAGIKGGVVHGATDELGFHAVEHPHYVTDLHATVLHLLGLDSRKLNIPGRKRLEVDYGKVMSQILA